MGTKKKEMRVRFSTQAKRLNENNAWRSKKVARKQTAPKRPDNRG